MKNLLAKNCNPLRFSTRFYLEDRNGAAFRLTSEDSSSSGPCFCYNKQVITIKPGHKEMRSTPKPFAVGGEYPTFRTYRRAHNFIGHFCEQHPDFGTNQFVIKSCRVLTTPMQPCRSEAEHRALQSLQNFRENSAMSLQPFTTPASYYLRRGMKVHALLIAAGHTNPVQKMALAHQTKTAISQFVSAYHRRKFATLLEEINEKA